MRGRTRVCCDYRRSVGPPSAHLPPLTPPHWRLPACSDYLNVLPRLGRQPTQVGDPALMRSLHEQLDTGEWGRSWRREVLEDKDVRDELLAKYPALDSYVMEMEMQAVAGAAASDEEEEEEEGGVDAATEGWERRRPLPLDAEELDVLEEMASSGW